jgi:hypothetical protein
LQEQIGSKIDRLVFKGNVKDHGEIDCKFSLFLHQSRNARQGTGANDAAFPAKLNGESGHIILEGRNDILTAPQISFVPIAGKAERFVWPLDDIVEIKKVRPPALLC